MGIRLPAWPLIVLLAAAGCVGMRDLQGAVRSRAARDLRCAEEKVRVETWEGDTELAGFEASGCGWKRAYAARCVIHQLALECNVTAANAAEPQPPFP